DALAAASLAGWFDDGDEDDAVPILLNPSDSLDPRVEDELERLFDCEAEGVEAKCYIIGGEGALSSNVEDDLEDLGFLDVERVGGADRYETAVDIAQELQSLGAENGQMFIATGEDWPDALSASGYSYCISCHDEDIYMPILLVRKNEIPDSTLDWLLANRDMNDTFVVGGPGVISSDVMSDLGYYSDGNVERIYGDNRFETCVALAEHEDLWAGNGPYHRDDGPQGQDFVFATGNNFPDSLTGSPLSRDYIPLLLTSSIDESVEDYLSEMFEGATPRDGTGYGFVLGETGAIDKETEDDIAELLSDGDFDPTTEKPEIKDFTVTIDPDNDIPDVAQYDEGDWIRFEVTTDEHIWNEDGMLGKVVIEDISELGGNEEPYDDGEYNIDWDSGDDTSDNDFDRDVEVQKKHTSPDERSVTFTAKATNQAGSDTETSSSVDIYN
ncbi:MAG: cell wall-binding repeat-containing protein, partial [Actinomycetia bacterium]|nr:cell wall-binding repeat-containing protein [Actinomycetes bacterium]